MLKNTSIQTKLTAGFLSISLFSVMIAYFSILQFHKIAVPLSDEIPASTKAVRESSRLDSLAQFIRYYDEVLTQSARNFALTQDPVWEKRYNDTDPELDGIIKEAISRGDATDKNFFSSIDASNLALVRLERRSIELVNAGRAKEAVAILDGAEYRNLKQVYESGLRYYVARRGQSYDEALTASTETVSRVASKTQDIISSSTLLLIAFSCFAIFLSILIGLVLASTISRPISQLALTAEAIARGELDRRVDIQSTNELGRMGVAFNDMADKLKDSNARLAGLVTDKTLKLGEKVKELEKTLHLMIGRENKMVELKKKISGLEKKSGMD